MGRPPPIIRAMPERKRFFSIDPFPKRLEGRTEVQTSVRNVGLSAPQTLYAQQSPDFMNCGTLQQSFCAAHNPISVPLKSLLTSGQLEILTAAGPSIAREQRCAAASEIFRSTGFPLNSAI